MINYIDLLTKLKTNAQNEHFKKKKKKKKKWKLILNV